MTRSSLTLKTARWSAEHPWRAILAWIVFVAVAVGLAIAVPTHETTDADYRIGESGHAEYRLRGMRGSNRSQAF